VIVRSDGGRDPISPPRRRGVIIVAALAAACVLVGGTWALATAFVSPQQLQAAAAPPASSPVLAEVTRGDIDDVRLVAAVVGHGGARDAVLSPLTGAARTVITSTELKAGDPVTPGAVVLTQNDQPVFAVDSPFPFYRDIGSGASGRDVEALQRTLQAAHLLDGVDGIYGPQTSRALVALFTGAGHDAPRRPHTGERGSASDAAPSPGPGEPYLPLSAVLAVDTLPAVVQSMPPVGRTVDATTVVSVSDPRIVVHGLAPEGLDPASLVGVPVTGDLGERGGFTGTLQATEPEPQADGQAERAPVADGESGASAGPAVTELVAIPDEATPLTPDMLGRAVTLAIPLSKIAHDELLVPSAAVAEDAGGSGAVLVQQSDGTTRRTPVTILGSLGGTVAVRAEDGQLVEGDWVVVG
jgi:peptidoglycan hydrolase-like protein with peptidoglycan-binding domain